MAENFEQYSDYYDSLYRSKEYGKECDYLGDLWQTYARAAPRTILDLGCGTGGHALELTGRDYRVTGIDGSPAMLTIARRKAATRGMAVNFHKDDIRSFQLPQTFDAAIAMFAVMGYLTTEDSFCSTLRCLRRHLIDGALFVFDLWYKEAVLTIGPEERIQDFDHDGTAIKRAVYPEIDPLASVVKVHYTIVASDGAPLAQEIHTVRFFSIAEIRAFAENTGFELIASHPFMKPAEKLSNDEWNITCILRAK